MWKNHLGSILRNFIFLEIVLHAMHCVCLYAYTVPWKGGYGAQFRFCPYHIVSDVPTHIFAYVDMFWDIFEHSYIPKSSRNGVWHKKWTPKFGLFSVFFCKYARRLEKSPIKWPISKCSRWKHAGNHSLQGIINPYFYTDKDEMIVWTFYTIVGETGQ